MKNSRLCHAALFGLLLLAPLPAFSQPELCETAAARAAAETGVPPDVLLAISLTETGRQTDGRLRPWPWAANRNGQGHWFETRAQALAYARQSLNQGHRSIDLGCFQINWRWHGENFDAPQDVLDPLTAARYAARHLADLHREFGDWERAAGAYHSRTEVHASRYRRRFARIRAALPTEPAHPPAQPDFPLLAGRANGASLVPAALTAPRPFIAMNR